MKWITFSRPERNGDIRADAVHSVDRAPESLHDSTIFGAPD